MTETTTTGTNINFNAQYCVHRLPCGYCQLMSRVCPMQGTTITPTWEPGPNVVYCNAKEDSHE